MISFAFFLFLFFHFFIFPYLLFFPLFFMISFFLFHIYAFYSKMHYDFYFFSFFFNKSYFFLSQINIFLFFCLFLLWDHGYSARLHDLFSCRYNTYLKIDHVIDSYFFSYLIYPDIHQPNAHTIDNNNTIFYFHPLHI